MSATLANAGYVFAAAGHGAFDPDGRVPGSPSAEEIAAHNAKLAEQELATLKATGRGVLYLSGPAGSQVISQWAGDLKIHPYHVRQSWHNMAGRNGRTDIWFSFDGSRWHGVNIGDNQILRVRRCKR